MRVFVDESGDTGMNGDPSSSPHFVVAAVIFPTTEEAERCSKGLDDLKAEFRKANQEFKFSKLKYKQRLRFLKVIAAYSFTYCVVILDKSKLDGQGFKFHESFYKYSIRMLFGNAKRYLTDATVCIDECGNQTFREALEKYLGRQINSKSPGRYIKTLEMKDSRTDNLLQLVDVVCGAIARSLKADKSDHRDYRPLIIDKEAGFQRWPKRKRKTQRKNTAKK